MRVNECVRSFMAAGSKQPYLLPPSAKAIASPNTLLPHPFGPMIAVKPLDDEEGGREEARPSRRTGDLKHLNPRSAR